MHCRLLARLCARVTLVVCVCAAPAFAVTHTVPAGGDLQAALSAAQPGDVIVLAAGATFSGNFRLPMTPGATPITVRTDAPLRDLPAAGTRVSPAYASVLAKIKSPNGSPALTAVDGAHHWRFELLEFQANAGGNGDIIVLGGSASQTSIAQMPHHLVFDRVYIHGDPVLGQKRGIALNSADTEILNSYIADIKAVGVDAQAICGWNGTGPYRIENNYIEASAENILFGGADPSVWNLVPSDITIRRNLLSKPLGWQSEKWLVKSAFQLKNGRRVLLEGNVLENVWRSGQAGFAIVLTPRNQNATAPWSVIEDVTIRYNVVRHAGGGINISGFDDEQPSAQTRRIQIAHNVFYDISTSWGGAGMFLQIGNAAADLVVERNTVLHDGTGVNVYGRRNGAPWLIDGFVFRENLMRHNRYGVIGDNLAVGTPTLNAYFTGLIFERNVLAGGEASRYPGGNYFPTLVEFDGGFANAGAEDFSLNATSPFRSLASDGGAVGADLAKLNAARGLPATGSGSAVCRPTAPCAAPPPSRNRQ